MHLHADQLDLFTVEQGSLNPLLVLSKRRPLNCFPYSATCAVCSVKFGAYVPDPERVCNGCHRHYFECGACLNVVPQAQESSMAQGMCKECCPEDEP